MSLTTDQVKSLMIALTSQDRGNAVADAINGGIDLASQSAFSVPLCKLATNVSQTVDFGALAVGDIVVHVLVIGNLVTFRTVATAGTLGEAAVVGDLYIAFRARAVPTASAVKF